MYYSQEINDEDAQVRALQEMVRLHEMFGDENLSAEYEKILEERVSLFMDHACVCMHARL